MRILLGLTCLVVSGCTQTVTMVHTQGNAEDVVDKTHSVVPDVSSDISPVINLPASVL